MNPSPAKSCPSCGERYETDVLFCPRDGTPLASARTSSLSNAERDPYLGLELPGQIRLKHLIGIGSMGRVYRAFQGGIERDVAVKVLHRELSGNAELVSRFHREAKVASRLVHPNVVQVLMTGSLPPTPDPRVGGELYLVMEHLDGISLLSALAAAGTAGESAALPLPRALHIALQICDAVGEAHAQGIVHRDLKPENVMLVRRGSDPDYAKVLDFGIARFDWADRDMATQAGLIFGTAKYISPEGAEGQPVGPPADVYSIATIIYQMLAGRTPFEGDSPVALLVQHTHAPPPSLRSIARASYVPAPLAAVIMANLAKKPAERAANASILGRDLVAAARQSGLFPEEIAAQSALFAPGAFGAVKLASRERTKALELSPDLAARLGGIIAASAEARPESSPGAREAMPSDPLRRAPSEAEIARPVSSSPFGVLAEPSAQSSRAAAPPPAPLAHATPPALGAGIPAGASPDLDFDDAAGERAHMATPSLSTIHGTETTLEGEPDAPLPRRARLSRLVAIVACALVTTPLVIVGGRSLSGGSAAGVSSPGSSTIDATLEDARAAMRRHAWDAPRGDNFKDITALGLARWPGSPQILDLRREAAERIVADALGRKYAGDVAEALRLARLALELHPALTTAQHLAAEIEGSSSPAIAPAAPGNSEGKAAPASAKGPRQGGREIRAAEPRVAGPKAEGPKAADPKAADPKAQPPSTAPSSAGAVLPPSPPPLPADHAPPAPASTGPWL